MNYISFLCIFQLLFYQKSIQKERTAGLCVMFLAENLKPLLSASIAFDQSNTLWAKPKPLLQAERARVKGNKSFYSCSVPFYRWIDADASWIGFAMICSRNCHVIRRSHELNCNQCAARHNSCRRQFTKARLSIHSTARLQVIACSPLRITRIWVVFLLKK